MGRTIATSSERQLLRPKTGLREISIVLGAVLGWWAVPQQVRADEGDDLAQQLSNPVASLISVPLQYNRDENFGPDERGDVTRLNIQPVIPFSLDADWNLITRTIVPIVGVDDLPAQGDSEAGLGDILASQFFSPVAPTAGGWIWGAGPVWLLPTATDDTLGAEQFGLGPTGVVLKQVGPWTYGMLANHVAPPGVMTAVLPDLHHPDQNDLQPEHRIQLRLGSGGVVSAGQYRRIAIVAAGAADPAGPGGRTLLG